MLSILRFALSLYLLLLYTRTHARTHMLMLMLTHMHARTHMLTHTHTHAHAHTHTHTHMYESSTELHAPRCEKDSPSANGKEDVTLATRGSGGQQLGLSLREGRRTEPE